MFDDSRQRLLFLIHIVCVFFTLFFGLFLVWCFCVGLYFAKVSLLHSMFMYLRMCKKTRWRNVLIICKLVCLLLMMIFRFQIISNFQLSLLFLSQHVNFKNNIAKKNNPREKSNNKTKKKLDCANWILHLQMWMPIRSNDFNLNICKFQLQNQ